MKIRAFGCSFIAGNELPSPNSTWPGIIADHIGLPYENHAVGGCGNYHISESILNAAAMDQMINQDSFFIINWTWLDRFDYAINDAAHWSTTLPGVRSEINDFHYRKMHSVYVDQIRALLAIKCVKDFLVDRRVPFIMTYMDHLLFGSVFEDCVGIMDIQRELRSIMSTFDGDDFLTWSKKKQFEISENQHPLGRAHAAAAEMWAPKIKDHIARWRRGVY